MKCRIKEHVFMVKFIFLDKPSSGQIEQLIALYKAEGWWKKGDTRKLLDKIIAGSHCFLAAQERGMIIGMGRAISDGVNDAYIQDVTVAGCCRKGGIGSQIIKRLVLRLKKDRFRWIGLIAADGTAGFYEKLGFKKMKNSHPMLFTGR
jgi:aralkylamine N-acetyltransferase